MNDYIGCKVIAKESYLNQLMGQPLKGVVVATFPTRKIRILWSNGDVSSHDIASPFMHQYQIAKGNVNLTPFA